MFKDRYNYEMIIYEFLRVRFFQKLVFLLEKLVHIKDKKQNRNYHFNMNTYDYINDFNKFLFYNASIHIKNICILSVYLFLRIIFGTLYTIEYILFLFLLKDIYCVMLQRYNYLRMMKFKDKQKMLNELRIKKYVEEYKKILMLDQNSKKTQLELVNMIIEKINNREIIVFNNEDELILQEVLEMVTSKE